MRESQVQSLDQEDPLEKEMATHSSILAWKTLRLLISLMEESSYPLPPPSTVLRVT